MAMGKSKRERQSELWIACDSLPRTPGHPFYEKLSAVLDEQGFDAFVERECASYYAEKTGRPSMPPAALRAAASFSRNSRLASVSRYSNWACGAPRR